MAWCLSLCWSIADCCSLPVVPSGTWYCRYCINMFQKEKFVEYNANARAAGRILGVDPIAQITSRCIRIVQTPDTELGGCVLCRSDLLCSCDMEYPFDQFPLMFFTFLFLVHILPFHPANKARFLQPSLVFHFIPPWTCTVIYK